MSLRQIVKPDFYVCEWYGEAVSGQFPIIARDYHEAYEEATNFVHEHPRGIGFELRRPSLIERIKAKP